MNQVNQKKRYLILKIVLLIFVIFSLILGFYIFYDKVISKNNRPQIDNQNEETAKINSKYKGLYAFKFIDDSVYTLLPDGSEEFIINYKNEAGCDNNLGCGKVKYEYIDNVLYLYVIGFQDSTYNVNQKKNIDVYSIDLTKSDIVLTKMYEIDKQDRYVDQVSQTDDAIYYMSYAWDKNLNKYVNKIYKFEKLSRKIQEIYDFKEYINSANFHIFTVNNDNLFVTYGDLYKQKLLSINLSNNEAKVVYDDISLSYYDNVSKSAIFNINDNDYETSTLRIVDLKDLTSKELVVKQVSNILYSVDDIIVCYEYNTNVLNIIGKDKYSINMNKYLSGIIGSVDIDLSDNYSVILYIHLMNGTNPQVYKINLKNGEVKQMDYFGRNVATYLYID